MLKSILLAASLMGIASPGLAQTPDWSVAGTAGVVSDYRYRGYSLSDEKPALQLGLTATHASGLYGDVYVSTIDEYGIGPDGDGARLEITGSVGWAGKIAGFDLDASVAAYRYPEGDDVNYVEFPLQVGRTVGPATWTVGAAYAPEQSALGDDDNAYGWAGLDYAPADWPVSFTGRLGYEDGAFAPGGKTDWTIGANHSVGAATLGLAWVDSDVTDGTVVASVFLSF